MPTTQNIVIDLNTRGAAPVAFTHQGDTARTFVFEVYNNGEEFDVSSYSVRVAALLPADNGYYVIAGENMATGDTYGNTITVTLPAEYTQKFGNGVLTLVLTGSGATIRPINIDLRIQKSADAPETIAGASDFVPVLQRYMAEDMQTYINAWLDAHPEAMQYYISGSKLVLDSNGILSIENDTDDIIEALDLDTLRADVTDLKSDLDEISIVNHNIFNVNEALEGYYNNSKELLPTDTTPSIPLKHVNIPLEVNDVIRFSVDSLVSVYNIGNVLSSDLTPLSIIRNGSAYASYTKYDDYYEVTALHANAKYLAITFPVNNSGSFMITKNNEFPSVYEPFGNQLDAEALPDNSIEQIKIKGAVIDRTPSMTNGGYISVTDGTINTLASASYSDYIDIDSVSEVYTALSQYVSIGYYDKEKTWLSGFDDSSQTSGIAKWFTLNPPTNARYVRVSNRTNVLNNENVICREQVFNTVQTLKNRTNTPNNVIGSMFKKSIHIGDSLTWSQVYTSASANRQAFQTYPDIFGKLCGIPSSLIGTPGAMPSTWWNSYSSQLTEHGLYIVFLGTNGGLTDTVDTDCVGDDISAYANTETGYYGKILQTIKSNNDVAVLVKCFGGGGSSLETTNNAIASLGARFDCPVIDINESERTNRYYHYFPDKTGYNALHFNDLGYDWMANVIFRKINALSLSDLWLIYPKQ